jgi:hypothetical protein
MKLHPVAALGVIAAAVLLGGCQPQRPSVSPVLTERPIAIMEAPENTISKHPWSFHDGDSFVAENEFVRRYRSVTGSHELDGNERDRTRKQRTAGYIVLGVAAAGVVTGALLMATSPGTTRASGSIDPQFGAGLVTASVSIFPVALIGLPYALRSPDGSDFEHLLTREQAEAYLKKYNVGVGQRVGPRVPPVP